MEDSSCFNLRCLKYFFVLMLIISMLAGCVHNNPEVDKHSTPEPMTPAPPALLTITALPQTGESSKDGNIPTYPGAKRISVDTADISKFIKNLLGADYLLFSSNTDFYWTETGAKDVIPDLNKRLIEDGWQIEIEWGHHDQNALIRSAWKKGDSELSILLFDDLDSVGIDSLSKNYGISGPVPGSTMFVMHAIDKSVQR
jgi:hypothetical protein